MTDDQRDLVIEALSMAANRKQQLAARLPPGNHHATMEQKMRALRILMIREREVRRTVARSRAKGRRCESDVVDLNGECIACAAAQGEACRDRQQRASA